MGGIRTDAGGADVGAVDFELAWVNGGVEVRRPLNEASGVAFEDAAPVREFPSYRGQRHFPGLYWSASTGRHVGFESWLAAMVSAPFADFTWRHARALLAGRGSDDTDEQAIAAVVEDLLTRAGAGPDRKVAARTRAAATVSAPLAAAPATVSEPDTDDEPASQDAVDLGVVPFGVFDAFTDGSRR